MLTNEGGIEYIDRTVLIGIFYYPAVCAGLVPMLSDPDHVKNVDTTVTVDIRLR